MSGGDTIFPGGIDTAYGAESDYLAGTFDNIDGSGTDFSAFMRRGESGILAMQTYFPCVIGKRAGATISNSSSAATTLASTISVPAILRAGSILEVRSRGIVTLNSGSPTLTFTALLGGVTYSLGTTGTLSLSASPRQYSILVAFTANTVGASADVHVDGRWNVSAPTSNGFDVNGSTVLGGNTGTVNTTAAMTFDLKATMSVANAANTLISGLTTVTHIPFVG